VASSKLPRFLTPRAAYLRRRRRLGEIPTSDLARVTRLSTAFVSLVERGHRRLSDKRYDQLLRALEFLEQERPGTAKSAVVPSAPPPPDETVREDHTQGAGTTKDPQPLRRCQTALPPARRSDDHPLTGAPR
jgi:hypothetical protein